MSTGGFGTDAASLGAFSAYTQWVVIVFHGDGRRFVRSSLPGADQPRASMWPTPSSGSTSASSEQHRWWPSSGISASPFHEAIRSGFFTVVSIVTTTGYATVDFAIWPVALQIPRARVDVRRRNDRLDRRVGQALSAWSALSGVAGRPSPRHTPARHVSGAPRQGHSQRPDRRVGAVVLSALHVHIS